MLFFFSVYSELAVYMVILSNDLTPQEDGVATATTVLDLEIRRVVGDSSLL